MDDDWVHVELNNDNHVRRLANALRSENDRTEDLLISFYFALPLPVARDLRDAIRSNTTLTKLRVYFLRQDVSTWSVLSVLLEGVAASTGITKLDLETTVDAAALIECLRTSTSIERLIFRDVNLIDRGCGTLLLDALSDGSLPRLKFLSLHSCKVEIARVAKMLEMNDTLEDLAIDQSDLREINIRMGDDGAFEVGDDGAVTIAKALAHNCSITTLMLAGCQIEEKGAVALAELLKRTNAIKMLDVYGNLFSNQGQRTFIDALSDNLSATNKGQRALVDALSVNLSVTHLRMILEPSLQQHIDHHEKINGFRQMYLEQDHSTISVAMYPRIFAGVSVKPSALFLLLQENRDMFIPYLPDPSGLSSSTRKRKVVGYNLASRG
jgi:hypothetical protein